MLLSAVIWIDSIHHQQTVETFLFYCLCFLQISTYFKQNFRGCCFLWRQSLLCSNIRCEFALKLTLLLRSNLWSHFENSGFRRCRVRHSFDLCNHYLSNQSILLRSTSWNRQILARGCFQSDELFLTPGWIQTIFLQHREFVKTKVQFLQFSLIYKYFLRNLLHFLA